MVFGSETGAGDSPIVLKEDVIKQIRAFIPTESEWNARQTEQVIESGSTAGGGTGDTIFTVPAGSTLFITFVNVSIMRESGTGVDTATLFAGTTSVSGKVLGRVHVGSTGAGAQGNIASNLTMPIKLVAGTEIQIFCDSTSFATGGFHGWLEKKKVVPI